MYVNRRVPVPAPRSADGPEASDVSQSAVARATKRITLEDIKYHDKYVETI